MPHYNVLFLCTGNSARSIIAEAILNRKACGKFRNDVMNRVHDLITSEAAR